MGKTAINIKDRKIVIFGTDEVAIKFCEIYKDVLNICFAITDHQQDVVLQPLKDLNIDTVLFEEAEICEEYLIIICTKDKFAQFTKLLRSNSYLEDKNYISSILAESILTQKKLAIFMGTEALDQVSHVLGYYEAFCKQYHIQYYSEDCLLKPYANRIEEYKHIARWCELYIHSVCEKNMYGLKTLKPEQLMEGCKIISISDYCFAGYYPQLNKDRNYISNYFYRQYDRLQMSYETLALAREDENIIRLCKAGKTVEEIVEILSDENFYSKEEVIENFQSSLSVVREADQMADIKLADFLKENISCGVTNKNLNEWNAGTIKYIVNSLFENIGMSIQNIELEDVEKLINDISGCEIPIYPSVIKHLEIDNIDAMKKYKIVTFYNKRYMDFKEYIKYAVEYIYKVMELEQIIYSEGNNDY